MTPHRSPVTTVPTDSHDRRLAPRIVRAGVPWLTALKPNVTGTAHLLNVSKTGVFFETRDRLAPGRRASLVVAAADSRTEKLRAMVVRSEVSAISSSGVVYRTALEFDHEFPWPLDEAAEETGPAAAVEGAAHLPGAHHAGDRHDDRVIDGPVDALFSTAAGSQFVGVTRLTATGCTVMTGAPLTADEWVSVVVFFSESVKPLLTGRVKGPTTDGRWAVRFSNVSAADRQMLKQELQRHAPGTHRAAAAQPGPAAAHAIAGLGLGPRSSGQPVTLHSAEW